MDKGGACTSIEEKTSYTKSYCELQNDPAVF